VAGQQARTEPNYTFIDTRRGTLDGIAATRSAS
jgi:hypothetical protein